MNKIFFIISFILSAFIFLSCSYSVYTEEGEIPDWYIETPLNSNYYVAVATATSKDLQLSLDKATSDARAEIGRLGGRRKKDRIN